MEFLTEPLGYEFFQRALVASLLIGVSCGLIGTYIMLRRLSLMGDALAHAVLPGVVIGFMIAGKNEVSLFLGALASGIITAILISFVERNSKIKEDTSIGIIFTGAFALGILLVSQMKNVHIDLSSYLFGDVLGVSNGDIILSGIITVVIIISVTLYYKQLMITSFDPTLASVMGISVAAIHYFLMTLLSMSIVTGLQSVGVILIIAMLITPPATAYLLSYKMKSILLLSVMFGVLSSVIGLYLSYYFNFASGASIVLTAVAFFVAAFFLSPKEGIFIKYFNRLSQSKLAMREDIIKNIYHLQNELSFSGIKSRFMSENKISRRKFDEIIASLIHKKLAILTGDKLTLSNEGKNSAEKIIRSHRLWETYVTEKGILNPSDIHQDAEKYEHILTDELLDELDEELGNPEKDPHGSVIPKPSPKIPDVPK